MYLEELAQTYNLLFINQDYNLHDGKGNEFNFEINGLSILIDPSSNVPYPFRAGFVCTDS